MTMETIDYKQKIKDYMNRSEVDTLYKSMLNNLFPELAESEDERIRKGLLSYFKKSKIGSFNGMDAKSVIAYLEKQGEQKPAEWKPSDEQMSALKEQCVYKKSTVAGEVLCELYHDLEKLKEE